MTALEALLQGGGFPSMINPEYLRRQAAVCLRLAATVHDKKAAEALVVMANDLSDRADEIDPNLASDGQATAEDGAAPTRCAWPTSS
jgi:hypothetical protein